MSVRFLWEYLATFQYVFFPSSSLLSFFPLFQCNWQMSLHF